MYLLDLLINAYLFLSEYLFLLNVLFEGSINSRGLTGVLRIKGGRMAEWLRALDFNAETRVQIPLWLLVGVVLGKCLVQLLSHPCI